MLGFVCNSELVGLGDFAQCGGILIAFYLFYNNVAHVPRKCRNHTATFHSTNGSLGTLLLLFLSLFNSRFDFGHETRHFINKLDGSNTSSKTSISLP